MEENEYLQGKRVALNFDLIQEELKKQFKNPLTAYGKLGKVLEGLGYEKRQQSSYLSVREREDYQVQADIEIIKKKLPWLADSANHFTATSENAIFDLNPVLHDDISSKDFIDFENSKGIEAEKRAIHFDLSVEKIDENYTYRSKPYVEIGRALHELGFYHQQGSGYVSEDELTPEEFAYTVQELKNKVPKLEKVVKHIDATYLKDVWNLMPYINPEYKSLDEELDNIRVDSAKEDLKGKMDNEILTEQDVLLLNKQVRYKEVTPNVLEEKMFKYESETYKIKELSLLDGTTKDVAVLEKVSTGEIFQDNDFASKTPFKLNLGKPKDIVKQNNKGIQQEKIKEK